MAGPIVCVWWCSNGLTALSNAVVYLCHRHTTALLYAQSVNSRCLLLTFVGRSQHRLSNNGVGRVVSRRGRVWCGIRVRGMRLLERILMTTFRRWSRVLAVVRMGVVLLLIVGLRLRLSSVMSVFEHIIKLRSRRRKMCQTKVNKSETTSRSSGVVWGNLWSLCGTGGSFSCCLGLG